ncbi:alginate export family protein [Aestuariivirga sp.]|uniref:alginate export family protein n=1 Tax=Aestuariivirga sp. TaxID=2650926 RepID=UPI00359462AA
MAWRQVETGLHLLQNIRRFGGTVLLLAILATGQLDACLVRPALAQSYGAELGFLSLPVETVTVAIANPRSDQTFNNRVTDGFRRFLAIYPGDRFNENAAAFAIARVRRNPDIADVTYSYALGRAGGLDVTFTITLAADGSTFSGRGYLITSNMADLPVLYDRDGTYVRAKLEALSLYYGNNNAWYGQPDAMLAGNPLVQGKPAGSGYSNWAEGYLHYGLYGITPLSDKFYIYGGLSSISSGSTGQELFTDQTRGYTHVEDAYAGFVTGTTDEKGNRLAFNFSAGRQKFTLANAFLIANTAANGWERAALQANARWAADLLVLGQVSYNGNKLEAFYLKPDELPVIDTHTELAGLNLETRPVNGMLAAASYVTALKSDFTYFNPDGTILGTRDGLNVFDARLTYRPLPANQAGPFFGAEAGLQTHREFEMFATAAYGEAGYSFVDKPWSPSISYRLSYFSGDDPDTGAYERWDPLLSGGNGEQWVQGASHFKVVQDSNVIAQRVQANFRPLPTVEVVPQLWAFQADSLNNIGGNPALSFLSDHQYGYEANVTVKWFPSRNWYVHGLLAYTIPGEAARNALDGDPEDWFAAMLFVRYSL